MSSCVASRTRVPADMCAVTCALLAALMVARSAAAQEPALRCRHELCQYTGTDNLGTPRFEVDGNNITIWYNFKWLMMNCNGAGVLDSPGLPRAEPALLVSGIELDRCPPPADGSLADTLTALSVTLECSERDQPRGNLTLFNLPTDPPLNAKHFAGFERLHHLEITGNAEALPSPERGFLAPLRNLRSLTIRDVLLPTSELPVTPTLENLKLTHWMEPQPIPLASCDSLQTLHLINPFLNVLPDGWLANCSHLNELVIVRANHLTALPANLLLGNSALKLLALEGASLETLPVGLLDNTPNLLTLQLKINRLRSLPNGTFGLAQKVQELDLSTNKLDSGVMEALAPLKNLTKLNLDGNTLGDVCGTDGYSPIRNSTKLKKLLLSWTSVVRICRDWKEDMPLLEMLDLTHMNVSELSLEDLQFTRTVKAVVILLEVSVKVVRMSRQDFNNAARNLSHGVSVLLDAVLECDCRMYWTRRALDLSLPALQDVGKLCCTNGRLLRDTPPEDMECARPEECKAAALPTECTCTTRPDHDSDHDRMMVRVHCENAMLDRFPRLRALNDSTERLYELLLAHNLIANLHADDLQHNIKGLDLRKNSLKGVDEETAKRLGNIDGPLRLAGNPLDCSCHAAPLLHALLHRDPAFTDRGNATCNDRIPLYNAPIVDCSDDASFTVPKSIMVCLASGFVTLLALAVAAITCLASRERRFFMLAVLYRWGCMWRTAEPEVGSDGRRYDAFVIFSHRNEATVLELVAKLEPSYRLCVHSRDWIPGRFISEQVVESVRESRRTVALVSQHFLASSWARAEFREAHAAAMLDARPRLIVVLLEEPAALEMDDCLRRYVTTHTYLRWGEPWFWEKLAVLLPRPRPPLAPEPAPSPIPVLELSPTPAQTITKLDASASSIAVSAGLYSG